MCEPGNRNPLARILGGMLLVMLGLFAWSPADATRCYVRFAAASDPYYPDGLSWETAYTKLYNALGQSYCSEIWVSEGVYHPGTQANHAFIIQPWMKVYGGFLPGDTQLDQRDPMEHLTVLSGDIEEDDATSWPHKITWDYKDIWGTNSQTVVFLDGTESPVTSSTVLDGFWISAGDNPDAAGAGLACLGQGSGSECSPTLANLVFVGNNAKDGGGMAIAAGDGGRATPTLSNIRFLNNHAVSRGGGFAVSAQNNGYTQINLEDVEFEGNVADGAGGGMFTTGANGGSIRPHFERVQFIENQAQEGGGLYVYTGAGQGMFKMEDVHFEANHALVTGGGMVNNATGAGNVLGRFFRTTFSNNVGDGDAGGIYNNCSDNSTCTLRFDNTTFAGNSTGGAGGAMVNAGGAGSNNMIVVTSSTFSGNTANVAGAVVNLSSQGNPISPSFGNSIFWGNTATYVPPVVYNQNASPHWQNNVIQGSPSGSGWNDSFGVDDGDNVSANPLLGPLQDNGGYTPTMVPHAVGVVLDTALEAVCSQEDQRGVVRPQFAGCDIGAVELRPMSLDVTVNGAGHVFAGSSPSPSSGVIQDCTDPAGGAGDCQATYIEQAQVELSINNIPAGWVFGGWGGDCSGSTTTIQVTMDSAKSCTATSYPKSYNVGGTVTGLGGAVALMLVPGNPMTPPSILPITANGSFTFPVPVAYTDSYTVSIVSQPSNPAQTCTITNGSGTMPAHDVTNIAVTCSPGYAHVNAEVTGSGTVTPTATTVPYGTTAPFTVSPDTGWRIDQVTGCGGSLSGAVYVTAPVSGDCSVQVSLVQADYRVVGGQVSGLQGNGLELSLNGGTQVLPIEGDGSFRFPGTLADGSTYAVTVQSQPTQPAQTCVVTRGMGTVSGSDVSNIGVQCMAAGAGLGLSIDDGTNFAAYGKVHDYTITLVNADASSSGAVTVQASLDAAFDAANVQWICVPGSPGATCPAQGSGTALGTANLPPATAVSWVLSVPVLSTSGAPSATISVSANGAGTVTDTNTLVLFRDGFEAWDSAGASVVRVDADKAGTVLAGRGSLKVLLPPWLQQGIRTVRQLSTKSWQVNVQQLRLHGHDYVRLRVEGSDGIQRVSPWSPVQTESPLVLGSMAGKEGRRLILLEGADKPLQLTLPKP